MILVPLKVMNPEPCLMSTDLTLKTIQDIASAFQRSRALLTAFELGIFTTINDQRLTSSEVAEAVAAAPRYVDRLMNALVALGLLEKAGDRFGNTPLAAAFLVRGRPGYMAGLGHSAHLWETWSHLTEVVRAGRPAARPAINDRGDDWIRPFIAAMHWRSRQTAAEMVGALDLAGVSRVIDIGGGSGAYAMAFARARAGISAVVFDLPNVVPLTRMYIKEESLSAHVEAVAGDYLRDSLGEGFDLALLSMVIHSHSPADNQALLARVARALAPGGQVVIQDFLMAEEREGPLQPALFALNMLVGTEGGDTYTESEVRGWLEAAGFGSVTRKDTTFGSSLVVGRL
jgi:ubiquinone/menaquinone biosynthesis C-methylase UbiE